MTQAWVLGQRALREAWRTPEALFPTLFIPLFFLVVNVGQAARIFPAHSTAFLHGQGYGAFQLPSSLLLAASFGSAALFLVEDIEGGYFDKLRATPVSRTAIVLGRLIAESIKGVLLAAAIVLLGLVFGISVASGVFGFVLLVGLAALWAVVFSGFMQSIALKTRSAAATNSAGLIFFPLLFLTPNFVPAQPAHEADGDRGNAQPGHLRDGGAALAHPPGHGVEQDPARLRGGHRPRSGDARAQRSLDSELRLMLLVICRLSRAVVPSNSEGRY